MTRDNLLLFNIKRAQRRRMLRIASTGFLAGVAIGAGLLYVSTFVAPGAGENRMTEPPAVAISSAQSAPVPAPRVAPPVMRALAPIGGSDCGRVSVHDGDTFRCDGIKVRLVAASGPVDAPELTASPRCEPGRDGWCDQALANEARQRLQELLASGPIHLDCAGEDRYGRLLCSANIAGRDVGDTLAREGLAVVRNDWR